MHRSPPRLEPTLVTLAALHALTGVQSGTGWSCKLDGQQGTHHCNPQSLHAIKPPPKDKVLAAFAHKRVATIAAGEVHSYLYDLQDDAEAPVDLRCLRPDSRLWFDVLTGTCDIASLSDDELSGLRYQAAGT